MDTLAESLNRREKGSRNVSDLILQILERSEKSFTQLRDECNCSQTVLGRHLLRLIKSDLVYKIEYSKGSFYRLSKK